MLHYEHSGRCLPLRQGCNERVAASSPAVEPYEVPSSEGTLQSYGWSRAYVNVDSTRGKRCTQRVGSRNIDIAPPPPVSDLVTDFVKLNPVGVAADRIKPGDQVGVLRQLRPIQGFAVLLPRRGRKGPSHCTTDSRERGARNIDSTHGAPSHQVHGCDLDGSVVLVEMFEERRVPRGFCALVHPRAEAGRCYMECTCRKQSKDLVTFRIWPVAAYRRGGWLHMLEEFGYIDASSHASNLSDDRAP
jgi:hypothetical protein